MLHSTDNFNAIGDIAGNFLTLKALLAKMPQDAEVLSLGDPNDRGPRSREVIEFLMKNGKTVNSNHAHMLVEEWKHQAMPGFRERYYEKGLLFFNGGTQTRWSYSGDNSSSEMISHIIPREHINFLENCPMYIETDKYAFTHAPLVYGRSLDEASDLGDGFAHWLRGNSNTSDNCLLWNRWVPNRPNPKLNGKINIFGHNSSDLTKVYTTQYPNGIKVKDTEHLRALLDLSLDHPVYGICLDTSGDKVLTGLHVPSMTLYQQEYID